MTMRKHGPIIGRPGQEINSGGDTLLPPVRPDWHLLEGYPPDRVVPPKPFRRHLAHFLLFWLGLGALVGLVGLSFTYEWVGIALLVLVGGALLVAIVWAGTA